MREIYSKRDIGINRNRKPKRQEKTEKERGEEAETGRRCSKLTDRCVCASCASEDEC